MTIEVDGARANARLIAAAPDLLSALETVKRWIIEEEQQEGAAMISKETLNNRFQDVRAAIDRATGHPASNP